MICLINKEWPNQEFPETEIHSIDSAIRTQEEQISLKAASNNDISIIGVSLFDFVIPDNENRLKVRFMVLDQPPEGAIVSYNAIEHITANSPFYYYYYLFIYLVSKKTALTNIQNKKLINIIQ